RGEGGQGGGGRDVSPGRNPAGDPQAVASLALGDEVHALGERWEVTAMLSYRDASGEWPVIRIEHGGTTAWLALEDDRIVRYDHIDLAVAPDGRAAWNGRLYTRSEMGNATVSRVVGPVDVTVGDTLSYQVLRSETDPRGWL